MNGVVIHHWCTLRALGILTTLESIGNFAKDVLSLYATIQITFGRVGGSILSISAVWPPDPKITTTPLDAGISRIRVTYSMVNVASRIQASSILSCQKETSRATINMVVQIEQDSITKAVDWTRSFLESSDKNAQGRSKDLLITELDQFIKIPRLIKDWSRWYKDFASRWLISIFKQALIPLPKSRDLNDLLIFGSRLSHSYATVLLPLDMLSDEL